MNQTIKHAIVGAICGGISAGILAATIQPKPKHPPSPVVKMSDEQLLKEWYYAHSDAYEIGCELDRRRIHANWRVPEGTNALGVIEVNLRGCWYREFYWKQSNDPHWRHVE